jgi:hypothetical protein
MVVVMVVAVKVAELVVRAEEAVFEGRRLVGEGGTVEMLLVVHG